MFAAVIVAALIIAAAVRGAPGASWRALRRLLVEERGDFPNPFSPGTWKHIWTNVSGGVGEIVSVIPALVDTLHTVVTAFVQLAGGVGSSLTDILTGAANVIFSAIANGAAAIIDGVGSLASLLYSVIANAGAAIIDGIGSLASLLYSVIANAGAAVIGRLDALVSTLYSVIANGAAAVIGRLDALVSTLFSVVANGATAIFGAVRDGAALIFSAIANAAAAVIDRIEIMAGAVVSLGRSVENIATDLPTKGIDVAKDHKKELIEILLGVGVMPELIPIIVADILSDGGVQGALTVGGKRIAEFGKDAAQELVGHIVGTGQVTPSSAPALFVEILAAQTAIGQVTHGLALAKSFLPTLGDAAASRLAVMLHELTGYQQTISTFYEPAMHAALGRPMEQLINANTITNLPGEGVLSELLGRRDIPDSVYDEQLGFHGYRAFWRSVFEPSSFRPPRIFELARIMQFSDVSEADLDRLLQLASYHDETIRLLKPALQGVALARPNARIVTEAMQAVENGYMDEGTFAATLGFSGMKPSEIDHWVVASRLSYLNVVKGELVSVWRSAAGRNAMSDAELSASLAAIGVSGEKAQIEVLRAQAARLKKPVADAAAAHEKAVNAARATYAQAYRLQFHKGLITEQELADRLIIIGYDPVQVGAIVELAKAEAIKAPPVAQDNSPEAVSRRVHAELQAAYVLQFQHDLIDAATLENQLVAIGVNPLEAASIRLREQARKVPSPTEAANRTAERVAREVLSSLKAAYARQFQDGFITADDLENDLVGAGMDPDAAHAFRLQQEAISFGVDEAGRTREERAHAVALQSAQRAALVEEFRKSLLTPDELQAGLVAIGIADDVAAAIVETEIARQFKPAPAPTVPPAAP